MKLYTYSIIMSTLLLLSCKNDGPERPKSMLGDDSENTQYLENPLKRERIEEMKKKSKAVDIPKLRGQALSILDYRAKNDSSTYAIIEADVWEYQFIFDGEMSKPDQYKGVWIDFLSDGTYEYGTNSKVDGSGRYNYHFERGELLMVDDQNSVKPQEWDVKNAGDAMVLIGTATYKDNAIQMKLERVNPSIRQ